MAKSSSPKNSPGIRAPAGGIQGVIDMFRAMEPQLRDSLMEKLKRQDPGLVEAVETGMFRFDDLKTLESVDLQRLLRDVPEMVLALAMRNASAELAAVIYGAMSARAAESLREAVGALGPRKLTDVVEAQKRVIARGRELGFIAK